MHVVVASKLLGESDGGSQRSISSLADRLLDAGHGVTAIATTLPDAAPHACVTVRTLAGYREALAQAQPDILFTQLLWSSAAIDTAQRLGVPSVFFSRLGECHSGADLVVFNSSFCADRHPSAAGYSTVLRPIVDAPIDPAPTREGRDVVVMVNPIRLKGGERLARIAAVTPEIRYLAIGGWWPPERDGIRLAGLANLAHVRPVADVTPVWRRAIALLVPSVWPEPAGRVIVEACSSGVPVIASGAGGMHEMHGDAGVIVSDADDERAWARAIRGVAHDPAHWRRLSRLGIAQARRYRRATAKCGEAFVERLGELGAAGPTDRPLSLAIPPELGTFEYLRRFVFDLGRNDFWD